MAGPWEKYQTPTAAPSGTPPVGPWTAYAESAPPKPEPAPVVAGWNPVGDELGNIYTPQPPPSPGDLRDTVWPSPAPRQAAPVDPSAPAGPLAAPVGGEFGDLSAQSWAQGEPVPEGKVAPAAKIANAAVQGWRDTPSILTPEGDDALNKLGPLFRQVINPGLKVLNVPIAAGNALMYGAAETANQVTGDARAGRDVMAALNTLPFIQAGKLPGPRAPAPVAEPPPRPRFMSEQFAPNVSELDPRNAIRTLIEHDITENPTPAPDRGTPNQTAHPLMEGFNREDPPSAAAASPAPATEPPGPGSVGAAASREGTPAGDIALTPEQSALYGSVADKQWLYKSKTPGEIDNNEYIKGIYPTMAQREQTTVAAREMKTQRNLSPEADQAERELLDDHNTKRKTHFQETAGSDVTQGIDIAAAEKNIDDALGKAFSAGGEVNHQPITRAIQAERAGPSGKLPPVKAVMKIIEDAMQKSDGSGLETDPTQVYGVRRVINYLQSKNFLAENPGYGDKDVQAALIRVKAAIDGAIEPVAPGFTKALADYHTARSAFDVNEALQKWEPKLIDGQGRMQYLPMHRMMNEIIQSRDPRAPLNPWQSMPEAQLNRLKSLHDDLQRVASADELAKARGSDTAMNALDAVKAAAKGLPGTVAAGVVGHIVGGPIGAAAGAAAKEGIQGVFTRRAERAATEKMNRLLRPDATQYPTRANPLYGPDGP